MQVFLVTIHAGDRGVVSAVKIIITVIASKAVNLRQKIGLLKHYFMSLGVLGTIVYVMDKTSMVQNINESQNITEVPPPVFVH